MRSACPVLFRDTRHKGQKVMWTLKTVSQGTNVKEAAASNIDGFLWRDTSISTTQLNRHFGIK
jgi:hypothetical protein